MGQIELTIFHAMLKMYAVYELFCTICFTKTCSPTKSWSCWEQVFVKQIVQNSSYTEYILNVARKDVNTISFLVCFDNVSYQC